MKNIVLQSTEFVVKNSQSVKLNKRKIGELVSRWVKGDINIPSWPAEMHLRSGREDDLLNYLFVLDALNFCFWPDAGLPKWEIKYQGNRYGGYFGLSLALKTAFENNFPITDFHYLKGINEKEFQKLFLGRGVLPLIRERLEILRSCSKILDEQYEGKFRNFVNAENNAPNLALKIANRFPSFDDKAVYGDKTIWFLKRAQILVADIWGAFRGRGIGGFKNMDQITAFADYKIPQILQYCGILEYSPTLLNKIKNKISLKAGSLEEIEIRSAAIWSVEFLKQELAKNKLHFNSFQIDWLLWNQSQDIDFLLPYHRVRTIYY